MNDLNNKLKRLAREDIIWIIYIFISFFALYSNYLDRDYLINHNNGAYKNERIINISIFIVAFFIYLYFVSIILNDINKQKKDFHNPSYRNTFYKLIASILFLIGGSIYLIEEIKYNPEQEIGFI